MQTVIEFFEKGEMLPELNHTNITLIPKVDNPTKVTQFRPISLCNVIYKLISKILAERLKRVLGKLILPFQLAFVPGRQIQDNYIVAAEIFHGMAHKRGKGGWMAIKADIEKAYDRVEWDCILKVLLGFAPKWVKWISQCISTTSFSVLLNGSSHGKFFPSRGIRRGDPLSPALFFLVSELLSRLLLKQESSGKLRGLKLCRGAPTISHLLFADHLLIFSKATERDAATIDNCLSDYMSWSGQRINKLKSSLHFSKNFSGPTKLTIMEMLQLKKLPAKHKHLGLPLLIP